MAEYKETEEEPMMVVKHHRGAVNGQKISWMPSRSMSKRI